MRRLIVLVVAFSLFPAASARAAWQIPAVALEGPDALVTGLGGVAVARDGTGGLVFLRADGVFVSRLAAGAFGPPGPVGPPGTEAKVAAGDGGELAVAWVSGGTVSATVAPDGASGFVAPVPVGGPGAENLDVDLGVNGVAYAVWEQGGDVRAARLQGTTWTPVASPLDLAAGDVAGTGALRPRVAVDAAGNALVVWGERESDGLTHVIARRLIGTALSAYPQDAGADADSPDVSSEYDGNFEWVVFRQTVSGVSHTFARHFLGSTFDPPVELDGGAASDAPRVSIDGRGDGAAVYHAAGDAVLGAALTKDAFAASQRLDAAGGAAAPDVSATDNGNVAAVWLAGGQSHGAFLEPGQPFQADTPLGNAALGAVADLQLAGDRVGDYAVAMLQGPAGARAVTVAVYDRPPGRPSVPSSTAYTRRARPVLRWTAGLELWGPQTFLVAIDGKVAGTSATESFVPPTPLRSGKHTFQVVAVDRAGQTTPSHTRSLRVDALAPRVSVALRGRRVRVRVRDRGGSGLSHANVSFGDRRTARGAKVTHVYARPGRYRLRVVAVDRAGNVARRTVRLRVR